MNIKLRIILIPFLIFTFSCVKNTNIEKLPPTIVNFEELPDDVQNQIAAPDEYFYFKVGRKYFENADSTRESLSDFLNRIDYTVGKFMFSKLDTLVTYFALYNEKPIENIYLKVNYDGSEVFDMAMVEPVFQADEEGLENYLNVKASKIEYENEVEGKVLIQYVVDESGQLTNIKPVYTTNDILVERALVLFDSIPTFKPAFHEGRYVKFRRVVPIYFYDSK